MEYKVTYLDNKDGTRVMETVVDAEDESEALDIAMKEDYYFVEIFGQLISIEEA